MVSLEVYHFWDGFVQDRCTQLANKTEELWYLENGSSSIKPSSHLFRLTDDKEDILQKEIKSLIQ
jgi:hypothetical protein